MGEEEPTKEKENGNGNYTFGQGTQPPRLFGEVGVSAVGSSGAVPEVHLNLPVTDRNSGGSSSNFEGQVDEAYDSGDSGATLIKHRRLFKQETSVSIDHAQSADQLQSLVEDVASQSLGGSELVEKNPNASLYSITAVDFNTSKRKPPSSLEASDEFDDGSTPTGKPTIKRLKSEGFMGGLPDQTVEECKLLSRMPPIKRSGSGRQIDGPVSKRHFWEPDRRTWHLNYPEMTQLQYDAFALAARERNEQFSPGKTPLWSLAMKYFPPVIPSERRNRRINTPTLIHSLDDDIAMELIPSTAAPDEDVVLDIPDTPETQIVVPVRRDKQALAIGLIESDSNSCIQGISCPITDSLMSFGRGLENTAVFESKTEPRVPKYALKILLWKEGFDPAKDPAKVLPPWKGDSTGDADSYYFWISSKATFGIRINGHILESSEPKNPAGPSVNWTKVYSGDTLLIWGNDDPNYQTKLKFQCFWGGSKHPRQDMQQLELAAPALAERLDSACLRTEKRIRDVAEKRNKISEAKAEDEDRVKRIDFERERSLAFEQNRLEAIEFLATRQGSSSRRTSPASVTTPTIFSTRLQTTMTRMSPEKDVVRSVR
jgi:hypothetical protein